MSTQLSEKIDDQEQYSRWLYLVFEGLNSVDDDNKNLSQEVVNIVRNELNVIVKISGDDIDKSHPIKKIKENIQQNLQNIEWQRQSTNIVRN